jgi:NADPH:quinone reductase-like Zn-dependent oxidoreductase
VKAVVVHEHGGFDQLQVEDRPKPEPGNGEVRVRLAAVGLNHLDVWVRRGVPGHTFPLPLIPGSDGAGVIDAVGDDVQTVKVGAEVIVLPGISCCECDACGAGNDQLCPEYGILGETRDGCCAEFVVVPAVNVVPKPERLSFPEAASFTLSYMTSWSMLQKAQILEGETVLVHGGASGVGSAAIQIAKLHKAEVIATASSAEKCAFAKKLGADHVIDYAKTDFVDEVRRIRGRAGVDIVFEHVGATTFDGSVKCLARGGRLVTCGATTGGNVQLSLHRLFFKNLSVIGSTMGSHADALMVIDLVGGGELQPVVDTVLPMSRVREGHEKLENRGVLGKIVLEPTA